ncbi:secondary metabolite regulator [Streptacidiphilus pinicola]|uniref:Secondary metabolite regulator n=1 Tax=Streptacidiphilus pinicola TaxID=2219663 RepID=A0A2X0K161_9ACTN|nr:transposase [Streptacidiphilus pinicola]RAG83025.1 secondary metabolite regulator [Streptacidiphilus pinicola]
MEGVVGRGAAEQSWGDVADDFVTEFSQRMLAPLRRRDQRARGEWYISGLLSVPGRKSMRALAVVAGHGAAEQSLHHFISDSSWRWEPVRQTLARHLDRVLLPQAWVLDSIAIPKAGEHSVGVEESFRSALGRVVKSQQAYGVWLATENMSVPVNWRLVLPPDWLTDDARRRRAKIPDDVALTSKEASAVDAAVEITGAEWGLRRRPVVMDAREANVPALVQEFNRHQIPFVLRVDGGTRLVGYDPSLPGRGERLFQAQQLIEWAKRWSRPVGWVDPDYSITRSILVSGTKAALPGTRRPGPDGAPQDLPLALVGGWSGTRGRPVELWLSNMAEVPPVALLRLGKLTRRVAKDFTEISSKVGMRDFEGRSFAGWHRHTTLCCVAHAITVLSCARRQGLEGPGEHSA